MMVLLLHGSRKNAGPMKTLSQCALMALAVTAVLASARPVVAHVQTLEWLSGVPMTHFLVNDHLGALMQQEQGRMDKPWRDQLRTGLNVVEADLLDTTKITRHDSAKLARVLLEVGT